MPVAELALLAWAPLVLILSMLAPPRTAILMAVIGGTLFLPIYSFSIPGFIDYGKVTATSFAAITILLLHRERFLADIPRLSEMWPALLLALVPGISILNVGLPPYAAMSDVVYASLQYSAPFLIGQIAFRCQRSRNQLAAACILGGLVYVPLCLFEIRMSPQLHTMVYGFFPHSFAQTFRWGGYRPQVFLNHGLMLGLWMAIATLISFAFMRWRGGTQKHRRRIQIITATLFVVCILCKSSGAILLLLAGLVAVYLCERKGWALPLILLSLAPPAFVAARTSQIINSEDVAPYIEWMPQERRDSLLFRLDSEDNLLKAGSGQLLFGRGPYEFLHYQDESGKTQTAIPDSMWIIWTSRTGVISVALFFLLLTLPVVQFWRKHGPPDPSSAASCFNAGLAIALTIFSLDCLVNALPHPIYLLMAGSLSCYGRTKRAA
ncbi:MAG: hypothetical protein CSA62_02715 [Planctomycetota bacterium]|nr:MAG: hypothetical protein CSA62_02715 [Planctomycetota bacterium]